MKPEIEAVFLDIDKEELRKKLEELSAKLLVPERMMKRVVFEQGEHAFARVRDEGDKIVATYKRFDDHTITGAREINVVVDSYDAMITFLKECGIRAKKYEESLRETWELDGVEIDIDTWPWLPTYVEIEGPTVEKTLEMSRRLCFDVKRAVYGSVDDIYEMYYEGVTSTDVHHWPEIVFARKPEGLKGKKRKSSL